MKITATRRDDILKRKSEYEADRATRQSQYDAQANKYHSAKQALLDSVESQVLSAIGDSTIDLQVRVDRYGFSEGLQVCVDSNQNRVHAEDKALSWDWRVWLDEDGTVKKETSSWSGLQATTRTQLDSLRETLRVLEILNSIDWAHILDEANRNTPKYEDYITMKNPSWEKSPNWDAELLEADLEEAINNKLAIKGVGYKYYRGDCWYLVVGETPKQYSVVEVSDFYRERSEDEFKSKFQEGYSYKISKSKFLEIIDNPVETREV